MVVGRNALVDRLTATTMAKIDQAYPLLGRTARRAARKHIMRAAAYCVDETAPRGLPADDVLAFVNTTTEFLFRQLSEVLLTRKE